MWQALCILIAAVFTVTAAVAAGKLLLWRLAVKLYRGEELLLAFVLGSGCLSLLVFLLAACGFAGRGVFECCGAILIGFFVWEGRKRAPGEPLPDYARFWKIVFLAGFAGFAVLYGLYAMAPEHSPEGSGRYLALVARYASGHGFARVTTGLRAGAPQGLEMLFLFAFALGRHSAAALVHFAFLLALPLLMLAYARRMGFAKAGVLGALFTFASPIVGVDGSSAVTDVALAAILFALFHLLQIWDLKRGTALLVPIGLLAGWAGAVSCAGLVGVPFALGFLGWKLIRARQPALRALMVVMGCAVLMTAPWLVRNGMVTGNPVSPFCNRWFPNPSVTASLERDYPRQTQTYGDIRNKLEIPLETAILGGTLGGLTGPLFLLAPVALLALRRRAGRQLLLAGAVFGVTYPLDIGTRFLIPCLPYISLGMGLAFFETRVLGLLLLAAHLFLSYPRVVATYCNPGAWRVETVQLRAALRLRPEEDFLASRLPAYAITRRLDQLVPPGGRIFTVRPVPAAYTSREVLVSGRGELNRELWEALRVALTPDRRPTRRRFFRFPGQRLRAIRIAVTAAGESEWTIHELRLFHEGRELPRAPGWRLRARPNPSHVQAAFDNSPVTFWRSGQDRNAGMSVEVDLGGYAELDTASIESSPDQGSIQLRLQGLTETGAWRDLPARAEYIDTVRPAGLRRAAIREFKAHGVHYILTTDSDFHARDFVEKPGLWGISEVARSGDFRLYQLR
jgi:hypothetical protein